MSAKDAPSEVNEKSRPNFDGSPNISSAVDEEQQAIDAAEAAKKQAETAQIDGVPIDEKDIKYKASDIKKKGKAEYFVNVEDSEERKKEATEIKRLNEAEDNRVIGELKKKATEVKRRNKAEDDRVIGELMKKASTRKKEYRVIARRNRKARIHDALFKGWHKIITISVIILILGAIAWLVVDAIFFAPGRREVEEIVKSNKKLDDEDQIINRMYEIFKTDPDPYTAASSYIEGELDKVDQNDDCGRYAKLSSAYATLILEKTTDYDKAKEVLDRIQCDIESSPEGYRDSYYSGYYLLYETLGDKEKANEYIQKLQTLYDYKKPNNDEVYEGELE